jgi:hypothetical protein
MDHSKNQVTFSSSAGGVHDTWLGTWFIEKYTKYKVRVERIKDLLLLYVNDEIRESVKINRDYSIFDTTEDLMIGCLNNQTSTNRLFHGYLNYVKVITTKDAVHGTGKGTSGGVIDPDVTFRERVIQLEPIGYWPMDEASGTVAMDHSGNNYDGVYTRGLPDYNQDPLAPGLGPSMGFSINGSSITRMEIPLAQAGDKFSHLAVDHRPFTIIGWFKQTATTTYNIVLNAWTNPGAGYSAYRIISKRSFQSPDNLNVISTPDTDLGEVVFFAWVKDPLDGKYKVFQNGEWYDNGQQYSSHGIASTYPIMIPGAADYNYYPLRGYFSDFAIFDKVVSDHDIEQLYQLGINPPPNIQSFDPFYDNVVSLLPLEDNFTDLKGLQWSVTGTPSIETINNSFGENALYLTGLESDLRISPTLLEANDIFTIDIWFYNDVTDHPYGMPIIGISGNGGNRDQFITLSPAVDSYRLRITRTAPLGGPFDITTDPIIGSNQWHHLEVSYDGTDMYVFIDGNLELKEAVPLGLVNTGEPFRIGRHYNPSYSQYRSQFQGYLKYFRLTKGIVRHTSSFTPPSSIDDYAPSPNNLDENIILLNDINLYSTVGDVYVEANYIVVTGASYAFIEIDELDSVSSYTISYEILIPSGSHSLANLYFGCNISGVGYYWRNDARTSLYDGLGTTTSWTNWSNPVGYTRTSIDTWTKVDIKIINKTQVEVYINNNLVYTQAVSLSGNYIALHGDSSIVTGGKFRNIQVRLED